MLAAGAVEQARRSTGSGQGADLLNGLPLCGFHNRLMEEGWEIEFDEHRVPWFIPPAALDPARRPLRGGHLARREAA
jgi:hypothetical protein